VGTELLLGDILNTNARFAARELAALGIDQLRQCVVGDNPERLRADFLCAWARADIVLLSGGLGSTADDITRQSVCAALGIQLEESAELLAEIQSFFMRRAQPMPQSNARQACVPKDARAFVPGQSTPSAADATYYFPNPNGTAPGLAIVREQKCAVLLPGPPSEFEPMFTHSVRDFLRPWTDGVLVSHTVRTMGIGESDMAERLADLLEGSNPTVAPYAKVGEAIVRVTARAESAQAAEERIAPILAQIRARLGAHVYGVDAESLEAVLVQRLTERGQTLSTAESLTGGGIAQRITAVAGASNVLSGSAVTYCDQSKRSVLGVHAQTLADHSAVSEQVATEMAENVRRQLGTDYALATTGYAGPDDPELHAWVALASERDTVTEHIRFARRDRAANRLYTENAALRLLWQALGTS
jgi:nicotinamide-nucleotide amidase